MVVATTRCSRLNLVAVEVGSFVKESFRLAEKLAVSIPNDFEYEVKLQPE